MRVTFPGPVTSKVRMIRQYLEEFDSQYPFVSSMARTFGVLQKKRKILPDVIVNKISEMDHAHLVTLTYDPKKGRIASGDILGFTRRLGEKSGRGQNPITYLWRLEQGTKEGGDHRYHYHLLILVPRGRRFEDGTFQGWWSIKGGR